jgi:threonine/homoserine efflux transporter RhtA
VDTAVAEAILHNSSVFNHHSIHLGAILAIAVAPVVEEHLHIVVLLAVALILLIVIENPARVIHQQYMMPQLSILTVLIVYMKHLYYHHHRHHLHKHR